MSSMQRGNSFALRVTDFKKVVGSRGFFIAIMVLFGLQALWIAISAAYPMVFDENTQFGIIQLYSHQLSPIFLHQPPHSGFAGPLTRQPAYLYQYLLSFPFRLFKLLTASQMLQIIGLRLVSTAFFAAGLLFFRRLFLRLGISSLVVNCSLLLFTAIPVVPLLAGQINYDNLLMLATGSSLWLMYDIHERLAARQELPMARIMSLVSILLLGSLVQFEFLPLLTAIVAWLAVNILRAYRTELATLWQHIVASWQTSAWRQKITLGIVSLVAVGLFTQLYVVNLVVYHSITPNCARVLSAQTCASYGPWARNEAAFLSRKPVSGDPISFSGGWGYRMAIGLFYTSSGGASPQAFYDSVNPLPISFAAFFLFSGVGILLVLRYAKSLSKQYPGLAIITLVSLFYTANLWFHNYADFLHYGQKLAINGRYIFPVLLPFIVMLVLGFQRLLRSRPRLQIASAGILTILLLQGGGVLTYIIDSNQYWYWPRSSIAPALNHAAQKVVDPLILDKKPLSSVQIPH